jgi:multiple antibiotic resistance protein
MNLDFNKLITVTFTLFAVVDIIGSIPLLVSLKEKICGIKPLSATIVAGEQSFAVGGSIVMFLLALKWCLVWKSSKVMRMQGPAL